MSERRELNLNTASYNKYVTIYSDPSAVPKACILYFHGGGLLYGDRHDLPDGHIERLTHAGYIICSYDYPLAPAASLEAIREDVRSSICHYIEHYPLYAGRRIPFFLWGRSAGAYLCLLSCAHGALPEKPLGILSYYGYGFLCDNWFQTPAGYYRTLPVVPASCLEHIPKEIHATGELDTHYSVYVYARQNGSWLSLLYNGREKFFYLDYTLRTCDHLGCPLFAAHSTNDTDVPYGEFLELCSRYHPEAPFIVPGDVHDFDREADNPFTDKLLGETLLFLEKYTP